MNKNLLRNLAILGAVLSFTGISGCGFRVINSGERGVRTTFGKASEKPLTAGLNFKCPLIQGITI
jgi:regulator of protease activity HflC (stomatin/prohibitin superfamily)